ncbi:hypothetical protein ACWHLZ_34820 [Streptomyces chartreusis]|uniref:hypothetical protein n=1 Tax=Streptomyces TaxID=1883 RepID=UPI0033CFE716|nr:hypothetical protein OG938_20885 [Streptomyces chartreusis]WTA28950.1 hypothetical protein OIA45_24345 [Streptomyces chartreusis]
MTADVAPAVRSAPTAPTTQSLRAAVVTFLGLDAGTSAPPAPASYEPLAHDDPAAALKWLNSWGCRIRYPRTGEPDLFGPALHEWTARWYKLLPEPGTRLGELTDDDIAPLGECYADLCVLAAGTPGRPRTLGATAASKLLHGLRPYSLVPWDEAIARKLHGARDAAAYLAHQRLNRDWARRVLADSGLDEEALANLYGCPGRPLSKMLDDYAYITLTRSDTR